MIIAGQSDMEVVGESADGDAAVADAPGVRPDVLVMDISMPRLNGLRAAERLRASIPALRIIILTRHSDEGYLRQLLGAGVAGYVLKQSRPGELLDAIRAVAGGRQYLDPAVAGLVMQRYGHRHPDAEGAAPHLGPRETEVLALVARGYSNKEIAGRLDLSVKTIETHKANAMRKLGMRSRIQVVRFALLQGWLDDE